MNKNKFAIALLAFQGVAMIGASVIASAVTPDVNLPEGAVIVIRNSTDRTTATDVHITTSPDIKFDIALPSINPDPMVRPEPTPGSNISTTNVQIIPGDANEDGKITVEDAYVILQAIVDNKTNLETMDYNKDGAVNALDAAEILKALA